MGEKHRKRGRRARREASSGVLYYDVEDAAYLLNVSSWTVRGMIRRGELGVVRLGPLIRIPARKFHEQFGEPYQVA